MPRSLINGAAFNLCWFGILYSQSNVIAPLLALALVVLHMHFFGRGLRELALIIAVFAFGLALDQALFAVGVFTLGGAPAMAPLWLSCLWAALATTLLHAFCFLHGRWALAAVFGAVGGGASYVAGTGMSQVAFGSALYGPVLIACLWAVLLPALLYIASSVVFTGEANDAAAQT